MPTLRGTSQSKRGASQRHYLAARLRQREHPLHAIKHQVQGVNFTDFVLKSFYARRGG